MAKAGTGFNKEYKCSDELREVIGAKTTTRANMTKQIWAYIKKRKLQDPKDKRTIVPDKLLAGVLGKKPINMFKMTKALSEHLS